MAAKKKSGTSMVQVKQTSKWEWAYGAWTITFDPEVSGEFDVKLDGDTVTSIAREDLADLPTIVERALGDTEKRDDRV